MNTCYKHCPTERERPHGLRSNSAFALSYGEYLARVFAVNLRSRLLALLASNSGESFPKVSINASRIAKGTIEDRFHFVVPEPWLCHTDVSVSVTSKMRSEQGKVTLVHQLGDEAIFLKAGDRKVARQP